MKDGEFVLYGPNMLGVLYAWQRFGAVARWGKDFVVTGFEQSQRHNPEACTQNLPH